MQGFITPTEAGLMARRSGYNLNPYEILAWMQENPRCIQNGMIHKDAFAKRFLQVRWFTGNQKPKRPNSYQKLLEKNKLLESVVSQQDQKIFALERKIDEFQNGKQLEFFEV